MYNQWHLVHMQDKLSVTLSKYQIVWGWGMEADSVCGLVCCGKSAAWQKTDRQTPNTTVQIDLVCSMMTGIVRWKKSLQSPTEGCKHNHPCWSVKWCPVVPLKGGTIQPVCEGQLERALDACEPEVFWAGSPLRCHAHVSVDCWSSVVTQKSSGTHIQWASGHFQQDADFYQPSQLTWPTKAEVTGWAAKSKTLF